jgi:hypothetical protein
MKMKKLILLSLLLIVSTAIQSQSIDKHRVIVLTDIENTNGEEPDDEQSLVRFLVYTNHFDVEGIIATTSIHLQNETREARIREIVRAYGKVRDNLNLHEPGFPTESYLQSRVKAGSSRFGMLGVGPDMDSEGSEWIIQVVDQREDNRPVWICVWGGTNTLAQALWKIQETRTPEQLALFVSKLRVYAISDQDNSGPWLRKEFPDLFYIVSPGGYYGRATWSGMAGEQWYRFASGGDTTIVTNRWLRENIMNKGPLGAEYRPTKFMMESDTPSFLSLINNGLHVPDRPDFGGWGGRYELYTPHFPSYMRYDYEEPETRPIWTDAIDEVSGPNGEVYHSNHATIWRWREAFQNDFAARMDWTIKPYNEANHPPVLQLKDKNEITLRMGESTTLDASGTFDPDGDELNYKWFHYPEAGTFFHWRGKRGLILENTDSSVLTIGIHPDVDVLKPNTTHIILQVTDTGTPALTRYQRVIVNILP